MLDPKIKQAARSIVRLTRATRDAARVVEDYIRATGDERARLDREIGRAALQLDVLRAQMVLCGADATAALLAGEERPSRRRMLRLQAAWEQAYARLTDAFERAQQEEDKPNGR